jgi:hypothetical protein
MVVPLEDMYLLTAVGLTPGGSSTVHIYTQSVHRTTQWTQTILRTTQMTAWEECRPCPVFASFTLAFALQLRKNHGKTSVRVAVLITQCVNDVAYMLCQFAKILRVSLCGRLDRCLTFLSV